MVTSTVWAPSAVNAWLVVQVPEPGACATVPTATGVPSAKSTVQVWVSLVAMSVKGAVNATGVPRVAVTPLAGAVMVTAGATLVRVRVVDFATGALTPSFAVRVRV